MTDNIDKLPPDALPSGMLNPEQLAKALAGLAAESGEQYEPLTAKELQLALEGEDPVYRPRWTQQESIRLEVAEEFITQMCGVYCDRRNRAERMGSLELAAFNDVQLEACWADRDSLSIYNPATVERLIKKYAPLLRAAQDSFADELREEETLGKLEKASQAVRESGDRRLADLERWGCEDAAQGAIGCVGSTYAAGISGD